jgi:hypothetical protein
MTTTKHLRRDERSDGAQPIEPASPPTPSSSPVPTARKELERVLEEVTRKATTNESLARHATAVIVLGSAVVPVLLLASTAWQPFALGKLLPSIVSACAAAAAGLLQFRRPYATLSLYRRYEGALRAERTRFDAGVRPYGHKSDRNRVLAEVVAWCEQHIQEERVSLIPHDWDVSGQSDAAMYD